MKRKLIINADGFGFTFGNNRAIFEVLQRGFVRSVSVNVTWPAVEEVRILARDFPDVSIGIHLNLSVGPPILSSSEIPTLLGTNGEFHGKHFNVLAFKHLIAPKEMKRELRAQIHCLLDMGISISHWDSHQGRFVCPGFFEAACEVCSEEGLRVTRTCDYYPVGPCPSLLLRMLKYYVRRPRQIMTHAYAKKRMISLRRAGFKMPDRRLVIRAMGEDAIYREDAWRVLLQTLPDGLNFTECHPGHPDDTLNQYSHLTESREKEWELFARADIARQAADFGVDCISHTEAFGTPPYVSVG